MGHMQFLCPIDILLITSNYQVNLVVIVVVIVVVVASGVFVFRLTLRVSLV